MEKLFALAILSLTVGLSWSRTVSLPLGPLVRVEGQALSLRCEVSDFEGPEEQDFDWKVTRGAQTTNIISTWDSLFPDEALKSRVLGGDISVHRLGGSVVELRIGQARVTDSATYTCSTPSTDAIMRGNYDADVQLRVIPNTLVLAPQVPVSVVTEGRSISLQCNVSQNFTDGIYLSVTWSIKKGQAGQEDLLTFGPDMDVSVGGSYGQRYTEDGLRLHLVPQGSYRLVLSGASPADQGTYICTARQWTREQGVWNRIQEKTAVMGDVTVIPTAESLTVHVLDNAVLAQGEPLNLSCLVAADDLTSLSLEVTWLLNGTQVLAHLDRDGVVTKSSNVLSTSQVGEGDFALEVHGVELSDLGLYSCRVGAWVQRSQGKWYQAAVKTSTPIQVLVTLKEPAFTVSLDSPRVAQYPGDPTELACRVNNISHLSGERLGVSWFYSSPGNEPVPVASLDANGALIPGERYRSLVEEGLIVVTRVEPIVFKLRLHRTSNVDAGEYACSVTTWTPTRQGTFRKSSDHRGPTLTVRLASKSPGLSVVARTVRQATSSGSTFEISCQAKPKNLQEGGALSVLVSMQEAIGSPSLKLASLGPELVFKVEDQRDPSRPDRLSLVKTGREEFLFRVRGVQVTDRGFYSCEVRAWTRQNESTWVEVIKGDSNKIQLAFEHKRPTFDLSISLFTTSVLPWETVKMECTVSVLGTPPNTEDVAYEIRWYQSWGSDSVTLLATMDRWGVVRKTARNDSSDCSVERLRAELFVLNIHGTQESDAGEFYCSVTPWTRSATTGVWSREHDITSKRVFLHVRFALWESMKFPLLYGACASLCVGLFSLVLGLVCAQCCYRNTTHSPRSRVKLVDLEID
ncbi:prostaglandin F2 receptor negative regulator [Brachyhypopomus gauderio]|uniref:prostaglandin F2 receptor negative regulator n=1 Tax=Brachyhypopomus gauderio TaxID=698409 RepID=UPI004041E59E